MEGTHASHLLVTSCVACNGRRKSRGVADWLRYLREATPETFDDVMRRLRLRHGPLNRSRGQLDAALAKYVQPRDPQEPREWFDRGGVLF